MDELHMARILLLLRTFGGKNGTESFDGLTKLAKLDFFLRYPCYLERALNKQTKKPRKRIARDNERKSIESQMIRYRYGPWDPRHRKTVNLLVAKGLAEAVEGRPTYIRLTEKGVEGELLIGIHPGAYYESQRWLPERFVELADQLCKMKALDLIYFGGPEDEALVNEICLKINKEVPIYIANDLRKFAALLSCCGILICNNSGPLHMAVALGTPTISFMGPTVKEKWMPMGGNIHKVLRIDDLPCIGCNLGYCKIKTHDCMRLITSSMVLGAVEDILQAGNK